MYLCSNAQRCGRGTKASRRTRRSRSETERTLPPAGVGAAGVARCGPRGGPTFDDVSATAMALMLSRVLLVSDRTVVRRLPNRPAPGDSPLVLLGQALPSGLECFAERHRASRSRRASRPARAAPGGTRRRHLTQRRLRGSGSLRPRVAWAPRGRVRWRGSTSPPTRSRDWRPAVRGRRVVRDEPDDEPHDGHAAMPRLGETSELARCCGVPGGTTSTGQAALRTSA